MNDNPKRIDPIRPTDDDARRLAQRLLRSTRAGSLATLEAGSGFPFASLVSFATDLDGTPLILVSQLSGHTTNLAADPRASLLLATTGKGDPLAHPRITLIVRARPVAREGAEGARVRTRFLARQPKAALYVDFPDFGFVALDIQRASLNGGFGRAYELIRDDLASPVPEGFADLAEGAVAHMNEDHQEALSLYATRLLGEEAGPWRATGLDPDGLDLAAGERIARLAFAAPVTEGGALRLVLKELADAARAKG